MVEKKEPYEISGDTVSGSSGEMTNSDIQYIEGAVDFASEPEPVDVWRDSIRGISRTNVTTYTDVYLDKVFFSWYSSGCPENSATLAKLLPVIIDESGRTLTVSRFRAIVEERGWKSRVKMLNDEVSRRVEKKALDDRVEMLNRQANLGRILQEKGLEFFESHPIDNSNSAIKAIVEGAQLERMSRGLPEALTRIAEMENSQLETTVARLLSRVDPDRLQESVEFTLSRSLSANVPISEIFSGSDQPVNSDDYVDSYAEPVDGEGE